MQAGQKHMVQSKLIVPFLFEIQEGHYCSIELGLPPQASTLVSFWEVVPAHLNFQKHSISFQAAAIPYSASFSCLPRPFSQLFLQPFRRLLYFDFIEYLFLIDAFLYGGTSNFMRI